ncbi:MAG: YqgE/AlgH family protein [Magnetococcales bacterium]|nr:YqgE/AlgH family protein [Magnetococcales bacterium]
MSQSSSLIGKLLIAMPNLEDPYFERTVTFMCAHTEEGALGIVINQPHMATMDEVLAQLSLQSDRLQQSIVNYGGPVSPERGFILYEDDLKLDGYLEVVPHLFMGTNPDILRKLVSGPHTGRFLFALGYAGWSAGQLEEEMREDSWLVTDLDRRILFDVPLENRWEAAVRLLGIDPAMIVGGNRISIN